MNKLTLIAGPCLAESLSLLDEVCSHLLQVIDNDKIDFYFKASYRKANRTSINSISGVGDSKALDWIAQIASKYNVKTITDIHSDNEAKMAAEFVDVLQIPAFLSRQTDILLAAGNTGKVVNIKKAQFMAPEDVIKAADKVRSTGNSQILLTERGTFFGYHDLVVDFRSMITMKQSIYPVIYDATHSVQQPSKGEVSGGRPEFILPLAYSALNLGIDGIFFETHPEPKLALSDAATQLKLSEVDSFINNLKKIYDFRQSL
ncbi:MAG TPA: 3-deoxy-8-phosphooctulonate synthase [Candidatus Kapabacteria bacterium]|nr:3-deoxy-8-phosphooctulonate synthase [Candidatus Kapabacteria bacterium]